MIRPALLALLLGTAAQAGDTAFITSQEAGTVAVIDIDSRAVLCVAKVGGKPAAVAVDPRLGLAYVVSPETRMLTILGRDCSQEGQVALEGGPFGVAVNPARGVVYVGDWYGARIVEIDPALQKIRRVFAVGAAPAGIAVTADGTQLISADRDDNQITILEAATGKALARVKVGKHPFGVTLHDGRAFTANVESDSVSVVDLATARLIATIAVGKRPYAVAFAAGKGFVTNQYEDTVSVFDAASFAPLASIEVGEYPEGIASTPDGEHVLVANWFSNTISIIDSASLSVVTEIEVPDGPRAFGDFILP